MVDRRFEGIIYLGIKDTNFTIITDAKFTSYLDFMSNIRDDVEIISVEKGALNCHISLLEEKKRLLFLTSSRLPDSIIKYKLGNHGFTIYHSYVIVPGNANPRWFLPRDGFGNENGGLVKPSRPKSRFAWWLAKVGNFIGVPELIFPTKLIIAVRDTSDVASQGILIDFLSRILGISPIKIALYTGASSYYQKFTVQIMGSNDKIIAYAKIGATKQACERIEKEAKTLESLSEIRFSRIKTPEILHYEYWERMKSAVLVQSPSPAGYTEWKSTLDLRHIDALGELFLKTQVLVSGTRVLSETKKQIDSLSPRHKTLEAVFKTIEKAFVVVAPFLNSKDIPLGLSHGDFTPWNVYLYNQNLFLYDWELASMRPPLWDAYNFILHSEVLIHGKESDEILEMTISPTGKYAELIKRYESSTGFSNYFNKEFLYSWYLIEVLLYYIHLFQKNFAYNIKSGKEIQNIINVASRMLNTMVYRMSNEKS